ncbi:MAG: HlyD family efflux transporter periplasmic adaptor subunit [Bacteroidota bacterium]
MSKQLFPSGFINATVDHYTFRIRNRSKAIYLLLLVALMVALISLPFITIDVTVLSGGLVSTRESNFGIISPVSAIIEKHSIYENQTIYEGDTLTIFDKSILNKEISQIEQRVKELDGFELDLTILISNPSVSERKLTTSAYRLARQQYIGGLERLKVNRDQAAKVYLRQKSLFNQQAIAEAELERDKATYDLAKSEITFYTKQAVSNWQQELLSFQQERDQLELKREQVQNEFPKYILLAPATGELSQVSSFRAGQFIQAGTKLAELSKDTTLYAICWLPPKDIGLIKEGMDASFRVDAFNANDWGFLNGSVLSISNDVYMMSNQPFFKVECLLDQYHLSLKNGFKGELKKGMTLQASFTITSRTLHQLLYDKVDNWLNPTFSKN